MPLAPASTLPNLLAQWQKRLQGWVLDGSLTAAAQEALGLGGEPKALADLVAAWARGNFNALPPVVLLSSADINGALGAYAISTGSIYLNADWLLSASQEQVNAVLTEELGHHLDGLLNAVDTPGDEGEYFSRLLSGQLLSNTEKQSLRKSNDIGTALVEGTVQNIENSSASEQPSWIKQYGTAGYEISNGLTVAADGKIWTVTSGRYLIDGQAKTNDSDNYITIFNPDGTISSSVYAGPIASQIIAGVSASGNRVYVGGQTIAGTIDGQVNSWGKTGYLTSYDLSGNKIWTRVLPGYTGTRSITSDSSGIYCAGFTYGGLNGNPSLGGADAFLAKFDTLGNLLWTRTIGGNGDNANGGINQVSGNGSYVAVAGHTNQPIDGQLEASGGFVSFFTASGTKLWTRMRTDGIGPVHVAQDNYIYISGSKAGTTDIYVTKLDPNGNTVWTNAYGSTGADYPIQLSINNDGELFVLGGTTGSYAGYANAGEYDNVFLRIDPNTGGLINATQWGVPASDQATQLSFASDGTLFIAGSIQAALPGNIFSGGTYDPYLIRFDIANSAPTDLTFISSGINENSPPGTVIGTLAATDPDAGLAFSYALVAGNGTDDADNTLVVIEGNQVKVKSGVVIDFETNPILNLNIRVTDNGGLSYTKAVTAALINVNEATVGSPLTGIINGSSQDDEYIGLTVGGNHAIAALTLTDPGGNNSVTAAGSAFVSLIQGSSFVFGNGFLTFNAKSTGGYYGRGIFSSSITTGSGGSLITLESIETNGVGFNWFTAAADNLTITGAGGNDQVNINVINEGEDAYGLLNSNLALGDGNDSLNISISGTLASTTAISGGTTNTGNGNDTLNISSTHHGITGTIIDLGSGDDTATINAKGYGLNNATLSTGEGLDHVVFGPATNNFYNIFNSTIDLGAGDDFVEIYSASTSTINGGSGNDELLVHGYSSEFLLTAINATSSKLTSTKDPNFALILESVESIRFTEDGTGALPNIYSGAPLTGIINGTLLDESYTGMAASGNYAIVNLTLSDPGGNNSVAAQGSSYFALISGSTFEFLDGFLTFNAKSTGGYYKAIYKFKRRTLRLRFLNL